MKATLPFKKKDALYPITVKVGIDYRKSSYLSIPEKQWKRGTKGAESHCVSGMDRYEDFLRLKIHLHQNIMYFTKI